jgi:succinate-acetate transporter protein
MANHRGTTADTPYPTSGTVARSYDDGPELNSYEGWTQRSRIVVSPIAAPSILGLFGFFTATIMVGTNLAGWWGSDASGLSLWPFALMFGGVAQLLAAMWSYRARDGLATGVHGAWGSFWLAWGVMQILVMTGEMTAIPLGTVNIAFAMWFVPLCALTGMAAFASLAESMGLFTVLSTLAGGSGVFAAGLWAGNLTLDRIAGWLFVVSAAAAWYTASAMMIAGTTGRTVLPLGKWKADANVPLREPVRPIEFAAGEPGVKAGQ